jgi:hypothetical protein
MGGSSWYSLELTLLVGKGEEARMQLVAQGENAPEDIGQWFRVWVEEEGCIPGLLATVTLDAFERWKVAGGRQPGEDGEGA